MSDVKSKCLPTYLVIDTSKSMLVHEALLNKTVDHVFDVLSDAPHVSEFAHISIITFNTDAHVVLPMSDIESVASVPNIMCSGATNYGAAFHLLRQRIDHDYHQLATARNVQRAAVFMLTDGAPNDKDWATELAALNDRGWRLRPAIISYGFGDANEAIIQKVGNTAAYLAIDAENETGAITSMLTDMLTTLAGSAKAQELVIPPNAPDGWTRVSTELPPENFD
jgi:uncharacterized protein YegL